MLEVIFWTALFIIFYAYFGYGVVIYILVKLKRLFSGIPEDQPFYYPDLTFVVPCFNEEDIVVSKAQNTLSLNYPKEKLRIVFVTDGSDDGTPDKLREIDGIEVMHSPERKGKTAAVNRALQLIDSEVVCLSDANTVLPNDALEQMMKHYQDDHVGAVSGEKRVMSKESDNASAAGEGLYWKYESALKRLDSEFYTLVGAAGELISFRRDMYEHLEEDSILDDFMLSMRIAAKGKKVTYEPKAYAMETASASVKEELKRKVRICAGAWQSMLRLFRLISPFRDFKLFFLYYSHRVLRWSLVPVLLLLIPFLNLALLDHGWIYQVVLLGQVMFYILAFLGYLFESKEIRIKPLFVPYYFFIMNYAAFAGFFRYLKGSQKAAWERSKRATPT